MFIPGKILQPSTMEHSSLVGPFVCCEQGPRSESLKNNYARCHSVDCRSAEGRGAKKKTSKMQQHQEEKQRNKERKWFLTKKNV